MRQGGASGRTTCGVCGRGPSPPLSPAPAVSQTQDVLMRTHHVQRHEHLLGHLDQQTTVLIQHSPKPQQLTAPR